MEKHHSPSIEPSVAPTSVFEPASRDEADARPTASLKEEFRDRERILPREKLLRDGPGALSDAELLAIQLRTGTQGRNVLAVARDLLRTYGDSLALLSQAGTEELRAFRGVGTVRAVTLASIFEIARRILSSSVEDRPDLRDPARVARYLRPFIVQRPTEGFFVLPLDRKGRLCGPVLRHQVSAGTADAAPVHPRDVFREAIRANAAFVVVAHNHPSGDPNPSPQDLRVTRDLVESGRLLGIPLLDHVVVGDIPSIRRAGESSDTVGVLDRTPRHTSIRLSGAVDFLA